MINPRIIGHIVAVQGFRVKVELLQEARSPSRATLDGVRTSVAINAYLSFSIGAGDVVIGIITDLEARESFDPGSGDELTLELVKPRRVAHVQLLGSVRHDGEDTLFDPGITVLPTLDTPAEIGSPNILRAVFENPPRRNRPEGYREKDYDFDLPLGSPTGDRASLVKASYNDLFSRPLAVVGNTGSGKSYTVSCLIQKAMKALDGSMQEPHVFLLDINGEYSGAFPSTATASERKPDHIYLDGKEFGVPIWFFNAAEICAWLSASEQTQEPVLKDWWALAKGGMKAQDAVSESLSYAVSKVQEMLEALDSNKPKKKICCQLFGILKAYIGATPIAAVADLAAALEPHMGSLTSRTPDWDPPANEIDIRRAARSVEIELIAAISRLHEEAKGGATTADSPLPVALKHLVDPALANRAVSAEDAGRIESHLTTLKLRLKTRRDDQRWHAFLNYEREGTKLASLRDWLAGFGIGIKKGPLVSVIDLSMLSHEVLPYATSVIGRILLEVREQLPSDQRHQHPWVLVLEEAHNYARPPRSDEDRGQTLSRLAFERIAKEGRKFGLSLIIASQRPSEISQTIISQCANFISHRLQNPDDIDHFRRIIPMQARRLLDQVTILSSGEAIVFGSAFHIPTRVQFDPPNPAPWSQTAAPYHAWRTATAPFPIDQLVRTKQTTKPR